MEQWISKDALIWLSVAGLSICAIVVPWLMVKMPADSFSNTPRYNWLGRKPAAVRIPLRILKNLVALGFIVLGAIMFVTPIPGIFPIVLGIFLADFPGKNTLQQWLLCRPKVMKSMNWLRRKFRRPPLLSPCAAGSR
ncbi:MAG TPA: hypothetical protein VH681_05350 [Nitrospiraceae bacterium]|jgi:hypothetical protein